MKVVDLAQVEVDVQERFLREFPEAMIYHSPKYRRLLLDVLGCQSHGVAVIDGNDLVGMVAVMEAYGPYGRVINSLPFYGSHGGLLARTETARCKLSNWYRTLTESDDVASATMIENPLARDSSVDNTPGDFTDYRIGQFTPLGSDKASSIGLMASLNSKTRNMVRKAISLGVTVETNAGELPELVQIHGENMRQLAARPKPDRFFELVPQLFQEDEEWQCWVGWMNDQVAAALLVLHFNGVSEYFTPVIREEFRSSQALSLVIFEAMRDSARRGMRWWNWGGTWPSQESVYRFKSRWGTVDYPYRYRTVVRNSVLRSLSPSELVAAYPHFYVLPFGMLDAR
jgi:hypothetical protein